MEVLVRVVEKGSFLAAAVSLNLTPSAISKHVSRIEMELGVSLLNRSTHELSLTEAGKIFHAHCVKILREIDTARDAAREASAALGGTLRLHLTPGLTARQFVLPALRRFLIKQPDITIDVTMTLETIDVVEGGFSASSETETTARPCRSRLPIVCWAAILRQMVVHRRPPKVRRTGQRSFSRE